MQYRRAKVPGAPYFFTVVKYQRQRLFDALEVVELLRESFRVVKQRHPFVIESMVVLPDHLHGIWTLPPEDADFSMRWRLIKSEFSRRCPEVYKRKRSASRVQKGEQAVWQRRFWEHQVRDERDFMQHVDYIHYNPVRHGLVKAPKDWEYSSFHRYVRDGCYPVDWGANEQIEFPPNIGNE